MGSKEAHLPLVSRTKVRAADREDKVYACQQRRASAKSVQSAHSNQAFQGTLTYLSQVNPAGKIIDISEGFFLTSLQDRIYWPMSNILHRP